MSFDDADISEDVRRAFERGLRLIGAIVGEQDNANQRRRNRLPQPIALLSKRPQARWQALLFISDRYRDNKAGRMGERSPTWANGRAPPLR